MTFSEV